MQIINWITDTPINWRYTVDDRVIDVTPQVTLLRSLDEHLSTACELNEAGFFFEEGGCFGMAIALHATLNAAGVEARFAVAEDFVHAYAEAHGELYDYRGKYYGEPPAGLAILEPNDFVLFAAQHGHDGNDLASAQDYAQTVIDTALSLGKEATPPSPSNSGPRL